MPRNKMHQYNRLGQKHTVLRNEKGYFVAMLTDDRKKTTMSIKIGDSDIRIDAKTISQIARVIKKHKS